MRYPILVFGLTSCAGSGPLCAPGPDPTLEIGLGLDGYTPIPEGGTVPLVHGPQGGWHLEIGLFATHLAADDLVAATLEGSVQGRILAAQDPWVDLRCRADGTGLQSWGTRLIYDTPTSAELDGVTTTVRASVVDLEGTRVSAERDFVIEDRP